MVIVSEEVESLDEVNEDELPVIPEDCLDLLYKLVQLIQNLLDQLYPLCLKEKSDSQEHSKRAYSSLSQDPSEWEEPNANTPCTGTSPLPSLGIAGETDLGERLLLMYDRWRKLSRSFYSTKKDRFDISKVPDIYDSAKYDAIHNGHLNLDLEVCACMKRSMP